MTAAPRPVSIMFACRDRHKKEGGFVWARMTSKCLHTKSERAQRRKPELGTRSTCCKVMRQSCDRMEPTYPPVYFKSDEMGRIAGEIKIIAMQNMKLSSL